MRMKSIALDRVAEPSSDHLWLSGDTPSLCVAETIRKRMTGRVPISSSRRLLTFARTAIGLRAGRSPRQTCSCFSSSTTPSHRPNYAIAHDELRESLSSEAEVSSNAYELTQHGKDESYHPAAPPDLVVYPASIADIQTVLALARRDSIPVIPFGAGTSVEGHIQAIHGGISLDLSRFFTNIQYNPESTPSLATVGAGVRRNQLNQYLKHSGYWFTVDPGADASLGGMYATAASGTTAVRYGTMRPNAVGCTCVLADGTVVHAGTPASPKTAVGYDLVALMAGSEGTLGVVTELTVRLQPVLEYRTTAVVVFDSLHDASQLAADLKTVEIPVLRCELLDAASVQAFNDYSDQKRDVKPTVFLEFQSYSETALKEQVDMTREFCSNPVSFESGNDPNLWAARHKLYYAAIASRPQATGAIVTDACVPLTAFSYVLEETVADVERSHVVGPCFGHAGDGNLHCILPVCDDDEMTGYWDKIHGVQTRLMDRTLAAGGSVSGEHGVGSGKKYYLERQYGSGALHMMRLVKQSLDPYNILNPGKVLP